MTRSLESPKRDEVVESHPSARRALGWGTPPNGTNRTCELRKDWGRTKMRAPPETVCELCYVFLA